MTTAREIIGGALTNGLNRLSPGETLDADLADTCLASLNLIIDECNGRSLLLFREIFTQSSAITTATGKIGITWAGINPGDNILGATVSYSPTLEVPLDQVTMGQYANISIKALSTYPSCYAYDGFDTVYIYPVPAGHKITLRTKENVAEFADLDTDYQMPSGYKSFFASVLAEKMALVLLGAIPASVARDAIAARRRIAGQNMEPEIIHGSGGNGRLARFLRGY